MLNNRTVEVTSAEAIGATLGELSSRCGWAVNFGRLKRAGEIVLAAADARLERGDLVSMVGPARLLDEVTAYLGRESDEHLDLDRSQFDYRRIFVSNPKIVGQTIGDLNLPQQFGAIATRVRRGDIEMLAHDKTVLELGDRVRVDGPPA